MKLLKILLTFTILLSVCLNAQEIKPGQTLESGTIENQFNYIIKKSYSYKEYKNVKLSWLNRLKRAVNDSLNVTKKELTDLKVVLDSKDIEITNLTTSLEATKKDVVQLNIEKTSINLLGFLISKPLYNTILWSIIAVLFGLLLVYILRFNRSNIITTGTNEKLDELEHEYDDHRQRSLEREQQLRRKLQDEINKQRKEK